ncbi:MAG: hypothetical protein R3232_07070 [Clostridia bacterium]|nr:hypothetical protein [Clostridia bacterium]
MYKIRVFGNIVAQRENETSAQVIAATIADEAGVPAMIEGPDKRPTLPRRIKAMQKFQGLTDEINDMKKYFTGHTEEAIAAREALEAAAGAIDDFWDSIKYEQHNFREE